MKNEFQKLVDRELSGLYWNERMRQSTLRCLEKEEKPVKKKMTAAMALTLTLVLIGSLALAAGLMFSPHYDMLKMADDALLDAYGITDELLPFFMRKADEATGTVTYVGMEDLRSVTGDYTVRFQDGSPVVSWSLEDAAGGWNAEKLAEINQICKQQGGYAKAYAMAREDEQRYQLAAPEKAEADPLTQEEMMALMQKQEKESQAVQQAAALTAEEMDRIGRAALKERFQLTEQQLSAMQLENDSCAWYIRNERKLFSLYYWLWQSENEWQEGNGVYIVDVNVETGAVEEIYYDNGLLGNG